jgi:type IV secretory pathway VirB2 component (pilin)
VTLAVPLLLILIGLALIAGRKSPPVVTAVVFLIIGFYIGQTSVGQEIVAGLDDLARILS